MLCLGWSTGAQLMPRGMRDPGSPTRDQTRVPCIGRLIPPGKSLARLLDESPAPPPFGQNPHEHLWVKQWGRCSAHRLPLTKPSLSPTQVWFQNARAKFRRNLLRQENTGVDKSTEAALQTGTPSGPASELSNASLSPSSTPTTLTDLTSPTLPTVTSVLTSVPGNLEGHEPHSPSQTTLTNLF